MSNTLKEQILTFIADNILSTIENHKLGTPVTRNYVLNSEKLNNDYLLTRNINNILYIPKYFKEEELVDKKTFLEFKKLGLSVFSFFDTELLLSIDTLRLMFGKTIINNWHIGGNFEFRGFRNEIVLFEKNKNIGSKFSAHKYWKAFDMSFIDLEEKFNKSNKVELYNIVRQIICESIKFEHQNITASNGNTTFIDSSCFKGINRMEKDITWLHIDSLKNKNSNGEIIYFAP